MTLIAQSKLIEDQRFQPPKTLDTLRFAPMLTLLAQFGCSRELIACLIEMAGISLLRDDRLFLVGPVVVSNAGSWHEIMPRWMPAQVAAERVEIALSLTSWPVGPTEIAAVMYAATMASPLASDLVDLYGWAVGHATARHRDKSAEEIWNSFGDRPVRDEDVIRPAGQLYHVYRDLAAEIRRKVVAAAVRNGATHRNKARAAIQTERPPIEVQEFKLFE